VAEVEVEGRLPAQGSNLGLATSRRFWNRSRSLSVGVFHARKKSMIIFG
jgi:hypothetical protein